MRYGDESVAIAEWVQTTLTADVGGLGALLGLTGAETMADRIWDGLAPEDTPYPFVTFDVGPWSDLNAALGPDPRLLVVAALSVKAVDLGETYARIAPIARRLVTLLNGTHNDAVSQGGLVLTCLRQQGLQYAEQANGLQYRHLGGVYEVITQ